MDSSPRPQRRFSRWQTTKRTFVLAGVAYKPTDVNTVLQNGNEQSDCARKTKKANSDKNDKNHKSILNHSTSDSVTTRRRHTSPLVAKSSVAIRLCLDTSRRKDSKTKVVEPAKTPPAQEAANDAVLNDHCARKDASVPQSTSVVMTEKCENSVKVDPPLLQEFRLQLERVDLRIHDISEDALQQNNKCALSNISQNKSTTEPSHSVPEDKSSTVHTLPSQKKSNVALDWATEEVPDADVFTNEANKRKRQAADDEKSSDSSGTDKENVEKDSANISVPSQSKTLKKDGVLHNMPSATRNVTFEDLNVSQKNKHDKNISQTFELSARRSSLRNRSLLVSPETLLRKRQYPMFPVAEKKTVPEKNLTMVNNVSGVEMGSSFNRKTPKHIMLRELELSRGKNTSSETINKTPLPELELSRAKDTSGSSFNRRTTGKMGSSELDVSKAKDTSSVNIGSCLSRKDQSKKQSTVKSVLKANSAHQKNQNKNKSVNSSRYDVSTPADSKSVHSVQSDNTESLIVKSGLRDRRTLPTPEKVQQQRQYPNSFLLTNRRSSIEKSDFGSKRDSLVKQQGTSIQDRDEFSQLEQTESSSASAKKSKALRNKNGTCNISKSRPQRKKCSTSLQHLSLCSYETAVQPTQQEEAGKLLEHTGNTSIEQPVGAEHMGVSAVTTIGTSSVEKETDCLSAHSVYSQNIDSSSVKSSVRDQLLLPTPEEVRQYQNKSFLTNSRSSVGKSNSDSKHDVSVKKQQKKGQNREATSQLDQTDQSSASAQKITKGKSLRNKNGTLVASSKQQPKRKKCSSPLQHSPLSSPEISEQPTQQRETEKVLEHVHNVAIEKAVSAENIRLCAKSGMNENSIEKTKDSRSVHVHNLCSEVSDSFSVKSGLRGRRKLPTPEEVQRQRQYPIKFFLNNRRSPTGRSDSDIKHNVSVKRQQKTVHNREVLSQSEPSSASKTIINMKSLTSSKNRKHTTLTRHPNSKKCLSPLQYYSLSSHETSTELTLQTETVKIPDSTHNKSIEKPVETNAENIEFRTTTRTGNNHVRKNTDSLSVHSVHSDSFSVKSGLRDRSMLATPEQVQRQRLYPIEFLLTNRSFEKSDSDCQQKVSGKKQQKKVIQNREPSSQLEQTEHSLMSSKIIKEKSAKRNKKETRADSKSLPERKKCVLPLQHVSHNSSETSEQLASEALEHHSPEPLVQHSPQRESSHNALIEKPVGGENTGVSFKAMNNVKDMNSNPSALEKMKKSHGLKTENRARTVQPTLNFNKTTFTANSAHLPEQRQVSAHKKQKLSEQDRFEDRVKNNRASILSKKSLSKQDRRQYSLPRRPIKKPVKSGYCVTSGEENGTSFEIADVSVEPIQQSATIVDTTFRRPQKLASKKHLPQQKSNPNINEKQPVGQKRAYVRRPDLSVNETMVVPKKVPRKRKLFEELDKAEGSSTQRINDDEGQHVIESSERDHTRKASHVTAFDVILQAVMDTEDQLLTETDDDALGHRLVRKVMGTLKKKIKPLISDVEEIKDLQREIRQKNSKICKLSAEIKEQKQLRAELHKEIQNGAGVGHDLDLNNVVETMKGYAQLMQAFANKSR